VADSPSEYALYSVAFALERRSRERARASRMDEPTIRIEACCRELPGTRFEDPADSGRPLKEPVHLGIQHGRDVVDVVPADRKEVTFVAEFRVGTNPDGSPNFLGPYAQGKPADRFFYLSWGVGTKDGGFEMFRRLKIRLGHLTWPAIRQAARSGRPLQVTLRLTDAKGGPLCATPPESHVRWSGAAPR
jgi:Family of unknown function (DUF5990)